MKPSVSQAEFVRRIAASSERIQSLALPEPLATAIMNLAGAAHYRQRMGRNRPALIGLVGCTGTGKSTIFNSLAGRPVSETSWKAHNTRGPILYAHSIFLDRLQEEEWEGAILLPRYPRQTQSKERTHATDSFQCLTMVLTDDAGWRSIALIDLPDINTVLAEEENHVARELQPWLDGVLFVLDEETLYHREYDFPVSYADRLGQERLCIINNRGSDRIDLNHPDVESVRNMFGVERLFILPEIQQGRAFVHEEAFTELSGALHEFAAPASAQPLLNALAPQASEMIEILSRRRTQFEALEDKLAQLARQTMRGYKPISMQRIVDDEILQALEFMGLRRFALGNLYQFMRRVTTTGSLIRSYQVAFGSNRAKTLESMLKFDVDKLKAEVDARVRDHIENIAVGVRKEPMMQELIPIAPELRHLAAQPLHLDYEKLAEALREFEDQCRQLLASDTMQNSLRNDPVATLTVFGVLIADWVTIPGFGSFALVPTVLKYFPYGQFERVRRQFQQSVKDVIRHALDQQIEQMQSAKHRLVLEEDDPLWIALRQVGRKP